jgi:hypothetical protein
MPYTEECRAKNKLNLAISPIRISLEALAKIFKIKLIFIMTPKQTCMNGGRLLITI